MSVNKAILIGNLGQDPELKYTNSGTAVANLSVATSDKRKDKDGNYEEKTEWHRVTAWNKVAENAAKYLKKGSKIYVEGKIETKKYEKDGVEKYSTEIVAFVIDFLDPKGGDSQGQAPSGGGNPSNDDIPF